MNNGRPPTRMNKLFSSDGITSIVLIVTGLVITFTGYRELTASCPNGYGVDDIITHRAENVRGVVISCKTTSVKVDTGFELRHWKWNHVVEFGEK